VVIKKTNSRSLTTARNQDILKELKTQAVFEKNQLRQK
jgi:hypothetical protein